jgi:hypothetical protein
MDAGSEGAVHGGVPRSGATVIAFCREMDLSPITFAQWQRDARRTAGKPARAGTTSGPAFARVEVLAAAPQFGAVTPERADAMPMVVRGATGHEAALDGVDAMTAIQIVALVLEPRR